MLRARRLSTSSAAAPGFFAISALTVPAASKITDHSRRLLQVFDEPPERGCSAQARSAVIMLFGYARISVMKGGACQVFGRRELPRLLQQRSETYADSLEDREDLRGRYASVAQAN